MKIVKFRDGTYGIRRGWFPWTHQYLSTRDSYWCSEVDCLEYCRFKTLEEAQRRFPDHGTPIVEQA